MWESVHALKTYLLFMESPKVENVHKLSFAFSEEETEGDNLKLPVRTWVRYKKEFPDKWMRDTGS